MSGELKRKLKTAFDESRLLILGAQVLFGFQFQAVFQELFAAVGPIGRLVHGVTLGLFVLTMGCLIVPSLAHQIAFRGIDHPVALRVASRFTEVSLIPMIIGVGGSFFVILQRPLGLVPATLSSVAVVIFGIALLYGVGLAIRREPSPMLTADETTLESKIEQLLTEARVMIPGGQALLGFQFVATLTRGFSDLPTLIQYVHVAGLCFIVTSVFLLMTPAALHRLAFHGEDSQEFFRIASRLVVAAALPLALGIAADVCVVFFKLSDSFPIGTAAAVVCLSVLICGWYVYPLALRRRISIVNGAQRWQVRH